MPFMYRLLTLLYLFLSAIAHASYPVEGKVIDRATKEPLAFVSIVIKGTQTVAYTNIEGKFRISSEMPGATLVFSYVGYRRMELTADGGSPMLVMMEAVDHQLNEVSVVAGENPAHRIIRRASQNRKFHNPEQINAYTCTIYSKTSYDLVKHRTEKDSLKADSLNASNASPKRDTSTTQDSTVFFLDRLISQSHVFMLESVYERNYLAPGRLNETVIATKASGLKNPSFSTSATDLQPFSFYDDLFHMLDKDYLNPIAAGSTSKYFFQLEDTLYQDRDSVYIISFRPLKGRNFNGLQGLLYINTNGYAIQNVIASPYDKGLLELKIQQQYQFADNRQWFPQQLNYELYFRNYPSKDMGMKLTGKSFIKEVKLNPALRKRDFGFATVTMEPEAAFHDSAYWKANRQDTLDAKEQLTYHLLDSLGTELHFDRKLKTLEALTTAQLPVSVFNIDLNRILRFNDYETVRLGFGAHTNDRLSRWFSVGGYAGYGFRDKVIKFGGDAKVNFKKNSKDYFLQYSYSDDIDEPGSSRYFYTTLNLTRNLLAYRMDHVIRQEVCFNVRVLNYLTMNVAFSRNQRTPHYSYTFYEDVLSLAQAPVFHSTELRIKGRYAYQEKLVQSFGQMISSGSRYPILHFAYTNGFKTPGLGDYRFNKLSVGIEKTVTLKNFGKTNLLLEGGKLEGIVPYPYLFQGNGSFTKDGYLFVRHTFQTMGLYEFLSDEYMNVFLSHNFGSLLFKTEKFRPEILVFTNVGYGALRDSSRHRDLDFKTMEKGYYESGLMINNIIRANYFNVCYLGLGGGAFMRYGAYAYPKWEDNMAYKLSLTVTF